MPINFSAALSWAGEAGRGMHSWAEKLFRAMVTGELRFTPEIKVGTLTGNNATVVVNLGFIPDYVKVVNVTDRDDMFEWFTGMSDGTAVRTKHPSGPDTMTTQGIAVVNDSTNGVYGFQIGTTISESTKSLRYIATLNRPTA